ncbi:MAG: FeoA family protein [Sphaerochaetaceae bacterium]|jgi:ferrous iron transport protein A|nr:ferrous iron transport protein A [Sphaerochaetaceae bacterium]NLO60122.1 ferrous iron transport protein A [Spirochaetales bacterium]MDD2406496.1 FeoA family protein [Sphaerochaetaceae bacterium]MDD3671430.1 FeoA family protein [Sphaerochaetaceae bacterium]MDD4259309.1 FeoA family protein [Sphaerochaetaceae bacterium]
MKNLSDIRPDETVIVIKVSGESSTMRRIMEMGITKGTAVTVKKIAPLGDPIEVTVRGYELTLRKSEASQVLVH